MAIVATHLSRIKLGLAPLGNFLIQGIPSTKKPLIGTAIPPPGSPVRDRDQLISVGQDHMGIGQGHIHK